jgi:3',5'-cyclic AMP phosphodiesterase CpdA
MDAGTVADAPGGEHDTGAFPSDASGGTDATAGDDGAGPRGEDAGPDPLLPLRIAVISDLNGSYGSTTYASTVHAAVDRVLALDPDVVLSTGDMVAGQRAGLDYRAMWSGFHAASGYATHAGERAIFISEWETTRKPDLEYLDDSSFPLRYSFTLGPVLFVSLDATTIGPLGGEQMAWVEDQLVAGADRPVKILYGHVPLYAFAQGRETEVIGDAELERIANEYGVTVLISGHHHAYYPGRRGDLRLVGTACVGSGPRALIGSSETSERSILLLEVDGGEIRLVEGYGGAAYDTIGPRASLPEQVGVSGARIRRDDL